MKWVMVGASWCSACLITKKHLRELQKEVQLEFSVLDVDFDEDQLQGLDLGQRLPVLFQEVNGKLLHLVTGEQSFKELKQLYETSNIS